MSKCQASDLTRAANIFSPRKMYSSTGKVIWCKFGSQITRNSCKGNYLVYCFLLWRSMIHGDHFILLKHSNMGNKIGMLIKHLDSWNFWRKTWAICNLLIIIYCCSSDTCDYCICLYDMAHRYKPSYRWRLIM